MSYTMLRASVHFIFRHILTSEFFHKIVKHTRQFVGELPTNCLSVFCPIVGLAYEGLTSEYFKRYFDQISLGTYEIKVAQTFDREHM